MDFAFDTASFRADPYPAYQLLRDHQPVWTAPDGRRVLSRHRDVTALLRSPDFGHGNDGQTIPAEFANEPAMQNLWRSMVLLDPPAHTRLRGLVAKAFSAKRIEDLRPRIAATVDDLINQVIGQGEMDLIRDFAHKLPVTIICDMLGVPDADRAPFLAQAQVLGRILDPTPISRAELDQSNARSSTLRDYWQGLFAYRRRDPGDDLISALLAARDNDDRLTDDEITANISLLFAAGHETTANLIGNGMLALARHPGQQAILAEDPSLIPAAIEEMLRYDSPVQLSARTALSDTAIAGVDIKAGERIIALLGSANHDPMAYDGDPDRLDVRRRNVKPVSFGGGIHYCLGAQLARIEAEIAFRALLARLPQISVIAPDQPQWKPTITLRGLKTLPVRW